MYKLSIKGTNYMEKVRDILVKLEACLQCLRCLPEFPAAFEDCSLQTLLWSRVRAKYPVRSQLVSFCVLKLSAGARLYEKRCTYMQEFGSTTLDCQLFSTQVLKSYTQHESFLWNLGQHYIPWIPLSVRRSIGFPHLQDRSV